MQAYTKSVRERAPLRLKKGPLSKLVDEADSKSAPVDPGSRFESGEGHSTHAVVGRPTRSAATAVVKAHVAVLDGKPLRAALSEALDQAERLGGSERRFVAFAVRELSRHQRLLELWARSAGHPASKLQLQEDEALLRYALWRHHVTGATAERVVVEIGLPGPVRPRSIPDNVLVRALEAPRPPLPPEPLERAATQHSFPGWLVDAIGRAAPTGELEAVLAALNLEPTLTLRARPAGTRAEVLAQLASLGVAAEACDELPDALRITDDRRAVFDSGPLKNGRLQVMDLGSQQLAALCQVTPGMTVVDWCSGAGGKALALADAVGPTGRVFAHDSSKRRLSEARRRAAELKLRQISFPDAPRLDLAQVILVDAPCSGTGTLGREPDQKWKLSAKAVAQFAQTQGEILDEVAAGAVPGAVVVYGTCSVLREEDEDVVEAFLARHPDFSLDGGSLRVWPHRSRSGGFFGARLKKHAGPVASRA